MISPRVDRLLEHVDSPYASVIVAAKRARQINRHFLADDERQFDESPPPLVDIGPGSDKPNTLSVAFEELLQDKLTVRAPTPVTAGEPDPEVAPPTDFLSQPEDQGPSPNDG